MLETTWSENGKATAETFYIKAPDVIFVVVVESFKSP